MQVVGRLLGQGRCDEDGPLVVPEHLEPVGDVGRMVLADDRLQFEVRTQERRPDFGHDFLAGVPLVAEPTAAEVAGQSGLVLRPVRQFVEQRGVVALGVLERFEGGHLDAPWRTSAFVFRQNASTCSIRRTGSRRGAARA